MTQNCQLYLQFGNIKSSLCPTIRLYTIHYIFTSILLLVFCEVSSSEDEGDVTTVQRCQLMLNK